jgi:23S rRNA (cytosine1962-C5)-methyltransferase
MNRIAFKIKKAAEKSVLQGHPWIFESSIIKQNKEGLAGDLAIIFNQRNDKFLAIGLYDPASPIRIRILHKGKPIQVNTSFFESKIKKAAVIRSSLLETETTAFRALYGENDGLPGLVIDIYNDIGVLKLYSEIWSPYLDIIISSLTKIYPLTAIVVRLSRLLQKRGLTLEDGDIIWGKIENEEIIFQEHGLKFKANLIKGHKTGYFLDHRHNRLKIRQLTENRKVLDIFSYAGGFSVNAIAGGAAEVTSLDLSAQALAKAKENVALNFEQANHKIMVADAFEGLNQLIANHEKFDLIICDPPSFAKSEKEIQKALHSYKRLVKLVVPLINSNGILLMASCSSRVEKESFFELITGEIKNCGRPFEIMETTTHDVDHPEGIKELSYLKSIYIKIG